MQPDGPGYTGAVMDPSGLIYLQARYYDPQLGRFLSTDPNDPDPQTGTNFNRYAYAEDDPYTRIDRSGRVGELFWSAPDQVTYTVRYFVVPKGDAALRVTPDEINSAISKAFSGTTSLNGLDVTVKAQAVPADGSIQHSNVLNVVSDTNGVTRSGRSETNAIGGDQITVGASGPNAATAATIAHELGGHAGGAGDQYAGGIDVHGQILENNASSEPNVMQTLSGKANEQTLDEILNAPTNTNTCAPDVHGANGGC
jgi:RHS repeat-associated protein